MAVRRQKLIEVLK